MDRNEKAKKDFKEQVQKLKEAPCSFPGCKRKQFINVGVPILKRTENGGLFAAYEERDQEGRPSSSLSVMMPCCPLHMPFMAGGLIGLVHESGEEENSGYSWVGQNDIHDTIAIVRALEASDELAKKMNLDRLEVAEAPEDD
jgi:hypothetical protein